MSISERKLAANRANAQKSTGPRSPQGKAVSAQNATYHGLYAKAAVINSPHLKENPTEYHALLANLLEELDPEGAFETQLVFTIANCLWRLKRAINAETAHLNQTLAREAAGEKAVASSSGGVGSVGAGELSEDERAFLEALAQKAAARSIPSGFFSDSLLRYEMRVDLRLVRAFRSLRELQRVRLRREERLARGK